MTGSERMAPESDLLQRLDASLERHRAEVEQIVQALTYLGELAGIPPGDNLSLWAASQHARRRDRIDEFDLDALDPPDEDESEEAVR
jgi:hypothetical protein